MKGTNSTGFSKETIEEAQSFINKDGSFNVVKKGHVKVLKDLYQFLLTVDVFRFSLFIFIFYLSINLFFALAYYSLGMEHFVNGSTGDPAEEFLNCLFFSFQTFSTLGYGHISPITVLSNVISVMEMFTGMVCLALLAGLVYARFSRPNTRLLFSDNILVAPYKAGQSLQFRFVNKRSTVLNDVKVRVIAAVTEMQDGEPQRVFHRLSLELDQIMFFPLTWTTVHPIDDRSPFFEKSPEEVQEMNPEIMIRVRAFSEQFNQYVHANFSYSYEDWIWDASFEKAFEMRRDGRFFIDIDDTHRYTEVDAEI